MGKNTQISDRVNVSKEKDHLFVLISGSIEQWKETMLLTWFLAWTICGIVVITQLFADHPRDVNLSLFIYMCFWFYFEYRIGYAWLWRKYGVEMIRVDDEGIKIKRDIRSYGKVKPYFRENIRSIKPLEINPQSFAATFNKSFWVVGGESLVMDYMGKQVALGMLLNDRERDQVIKTLNRGLQDYAKSSN